MGNIVTTLVAYLPFLRILQEKCRGKQTVGPDSEPLIEGRDDRQDLVVEHISQQPEAEELERSQVMSPGTHADLAAAERILQAAEAPSFVGKAHDDTLTFQEPETTSVQESVEPSFNPEFDNTLDLLTRGSESRVAVDSMIGDELIEDQQVLEYNSEIEEDDHDMDMERSNNETILLLADGLSNSVTKETILTAVQEGEEGEEEGRRADCEEVMQEIEADIFSQEVEAHQGQDIPDVQEFKSFKEPASEETNSEKLSMRVNLSAENSPSKVYDNFFGVNERSESLEEQITSSSDGIKVVVDLNPKKEELEEEQEQEVDVEEDPYTQNLASSEVSEINDSGLSNEISEKIEAETITKPVRKRVSVSFQEPEPQPEPETDPEHDLDIDQVGEIISKTAIADSITNILSAQDE